MALSRVQLLRILTRHRLSGITSSCRSRSHEAGDVKGTAVDVSEISALKDFVDDAIVRGSSLVVADQTEKGDSQDTDHTDIHQRFFLKYTDLRKKELQQALLIYDQSVDVDDFVQRYHSSPTLSIAGVIAAPQVLYHKVADVKKVMGLGLSPMDSLKALTMLHESTIRRRAPILQELAGSVSGCRSLRDNEYKTVTRSSLYQARKKKLIDDTDIIRNLVHRLPLSEDLKEQLIEGSHAACDSHLEAISGSEVKIVILNEYLKLTFPNHKLNTVTEKDFGKLLYFRLQDGVEIVDIIREDAKCMDKLSRIHFGSLINRLTPEELRRVLRDMPFIGNVHISFLFNKTLSSVFKNGFDKFRERYQFLRSEGFTDGEILTRPEVFLMGDETRDERLKYWYNALGKSNVVLSNMGTFLIRHHVKARYRYEVIHGKKQVPIHYVTHCRKMKCDNVITGYLHEFCNKFSFAADPFIDRIYASTHFVTQKFNLANLYNVYHFLSEQNVRREQLENSPYILVTEMDKVRQAFDELSSTGAIDRWISHPRLLDLVVYMCHTNESVDHAAITKQRTQNLPGRGNATSPAPDPIKNAVPKSGTEFVVHDHQAGASIRYGLYATAGNPHAAGKSRQSNQRK